MELMLKPKPASRKLISEGASILALGLCLLTGCVTRSDHQPPGPAFPAQTDWTQLQPPDWTFPAQGDWLETERELKAGL